MRETVTLERWKIFVKGQLVTGIATNNNLNFGLSQTALKLCFGGYAMICQRIDLSLIDSMSPLYVFLFLRPIQTEIVTSAMKRIGFFGDPVFDFSIPYLNSFILSLFLRLRQFSSPEKCYSAHLAHFGGAHCVMVGNWLGKLSSNPGRGCLHFI